MFMYILCMQTVLQIRFIVQHDDAIPVQDDAIYTCRSANIYKFITWR